MNIEPLESRIAPASLAGQVLTYTDTDGDKVAITFSKGTLAGSMFTFDTGSVDGDNSVKQQLQKINVSAATGIDGADISMKVIKAGGGDGLAAVGRIDASMHDLGNVILKGDLGGITCGDSDASTGPGLKLLNVRSIGAYGTTTQGAGGDLFSAVQGSLGALKVRGDIRDASFGARNFGDLPDGRIGSVTIGGSLIGGDDFAGFLSSTGDIGPVNIKHDLIGDVGDDSGEISSGGTLGAVTIGGNVIGGAGKDSGRVLSAGAMGTVKIGGDLVGGGGIESGQVKCNGTLGDVRIGGDLVGGPTVSSGEIFAGPMGNLRIGGSLIGGGSFSGFVLVGTIGAVRIGGDLIGGSISGSDSLQRSGGIVSNGHIASVTIGGSFIAGTDASSGSLFNCGSIVANFDIGPVKIGGSIVGNSTNPALIIARGQTMKPATGFDTAIASLTVGGDVSYAKILAGFSDSSFPINADAAIGPVKVGRTWVASSLVAGARDSGMDGFGVNDTLQTNGDTALIARIASITIKGEVAGSLAAGDNFGFVAQQINKLKIAGRTFALAPGPSSAADNILIPFTDDVHLLEP